MATSYEREGKPLNNFWTSDSAMHQLQTTPGGCKSAANFHDCADVWFSALITNLLAWLDDSAVFKRLDEGPLSIESQFFALCEKHILVALL